MCKVDMLRAFLNQRLSAAVDEIVVVFERTIAEYEEELCRTKEENERQRQLLDAIFTPQVAVQRAEVREENIQSVQQEWSSPVEHQEPEAPYIKKEEQEDDIINLPLTVVPVKSECEEGKSPSEQNSWAEPPSGSSSHHVTREDDGDHYGRSREENLLAPISDNDYIMPHSPDTDEEHLKDIREDTGSPEQQEWSSRVEQQEPEPPRIKEEEDERSINEEAKQIEGLDFSVIHVVVKSEDDEGGPHSSQLHGSDCEKRSQADSLLSPLSESEDTPSHSPDTDDDEHSKCDQICRADNKHLACSVCGRSLYDKKTLKVHMRTHTGEKPFICTICGKTFAQRGNLIKHTRTHTGEKPFTCPFCSTSFSDSSTLVKHMRRHTGEKPFSCSLCGEKFSRKSNLTTHMRTHTGEKPFACSVCGTTFSDRSTLNKHMRTHTGEKPFSCSVCGQRFSQKGHMTTHARRHTGEKPFACSVCHTSFSDRSTFVRHMRRHTGQTHLPASEEKMH